MFVCRYGAGDKVEAWLNELLCLNASEHVPKPPPQLPQLEECELFYVERDTLFSFHKVPLQATCRPCPPSSMIFKSALCLHCSLSMQSHVSAECEEESEGLSFYFLHVHLLLLCKRALHYFAP